MSDIFHGIYSPFFDRSARIRVAKDRLGVSQILGLAFMAFLKSSCGEFVLLFLGKNKNRPKTFGTWKNSEPCLHISLRRNCGKDQKLNSTACDCHIQPDLRICFDLHVLVLARFLLLYDSLMTALYRPHLRQFLLSISCFKTHVSG